MTLLFSDAKLILNGQGHIKSPNASAVDPMVKEDHPKTKDEKFTEHVEPNLKQAVRSKERQETRRNIKPLPKRSTKPNQACKPLGDTKMTTTKIEFTTNTTGVRIAFRNNRAIATIEKTDDGKYRVINLYNQFVKDCDSYTEARNEALTAPSVRPDNLVKFGPRKKKPAAATGQSATA